VVRELTDGTAGDKGNSENVLIRPASLTSNQTRATQGLNTKSIISTNDGGDSVSDLAILLDLLGNDITSASILKAALLLRSEVEIFELL